jgi:long-chain acyl-CoA synthetase
VELRDAALDDEALTELDGVCTMLFTAADDGYAKAAMLTHENMLSNARSLAECDQLDETTPACGLIPFHHLFALQTGLITPAVCSAPICVLGPERLLRFRTAVAELKAGRVARLYSVPIVFYILGKAWASTGAEALPTTLGSGGVKLPLSVLERYRKVFGREIHEGYGLTEAAPICAWHRPMDWIRPGSVGRAFGCCELCVEDESGNVLPVGDVGEVCVRGANVMKGYFRHPIATERAVRRRWLHTGDLGRLDHDGFLYLTGLKKRMLNVAGTKVYPAEVERLMCFHSNVEEAAISGEVQELQGQAVVARIRLRTKGPTAEQAFRLWCSQNVSAHKIPLRIVFD